MTDGSEIKVNFHNELVSFCRSDSSNIFGDSVSLVQSSESNISVSTTDVKDEILKALKLNNELIQKLLQKD